MAEFKPTLNTVDPSIYETYVPKDAASRVNYSQISKDFTKVFTDISDEKQRKKKEIDDSADELYSSVAKIELNADKTFSDGVLEFANSLKQSLMMQQKLLKKGELAPQDFRRSMQRAKDQMAQWGIAAKSYKAYNERTMTRINDNSSGADERFLAQGNEGINNMNGKRNYFDPGTMTSYIITLNEDGSTPSFEDNPEAYLPASSVNSRTNFQSSRTSGDIQFQVNEYADTIGQFIKTSVKGTAVDGLPGVYLLSEENVRLIDTDPQIKAQLTDLKDAIYDKVSYDDTVLSRTAVQMGDEFKYAQSLKQFKELHPGKDEKYWIKVNANTNPPTFEPNDKSFLEGEVRKKTDLEFETQMGKMIQSKSGVQFPQANSTTIGQNAVEQENVGYLTRVNDIVAGDMSSFSSSSARGIQDMNKGKTREEDLIDSIKRQGDNIVITYQNGKKETISRKDTNGTMRTTEDLAGEIFELVTPATMSYDDTLIAYRKGNKKLTKSTRNMTDVEISSEIKISNATTSLVDAFKADLDAKVLANTITQEEADTELAGYKPTTDAIKAAAKGITVTAAELDAAKANGKIPQTYVGEDAVNYAARNPYPIKSAGSAIIRDGNSKLPNVTGAEELNKIASGQTTLPSFGYSITSRRKKQIDGPLQKVLTAYLPSALRSNSKVEFDAATKRIVITFNNKVINVPGVSDLDIGKATTFVKLDQMLAEAGQQITNQANNELANRKGGKPTAY
tara:strand:- start:18111 stop:20312 length:2202 start_codon:yes stop_codon:yes gene_type:complete